METQQAAHPAPRTLAAFALNRLPAEARERLQAHLRSCASCSDFLARTPQHELQALLGNSVERSRAEQSTPGERHRDTIHSPGPPPLPAQTSAGLRPPNPAKPAVPSQMLPAAAADAIPAALREQSKYRVVRLLGRGGMGSVYEARHERMDRRVAIKVINPELVGNPQAVERFNAEVQAVSKLDHTNIARAYDAETFGSLQAIIMEFVEGQTLYDFMKARQRAGGQLSVTDACRLIRQALLGLQHAHERGIAHRDLKPQNLMLTRDKGIVKILDFGLAKLTNDRRGLTKTNVTMGTYEYLAPEQALDAATAGPRADIYSLGCTLYYLLAGVLPFAHDTDVKLLLAHQNETPRPLVELRPDVPQELSDLVARMLAKNPADRPQTPAEIAQALLPYAKGEVPPPAAQQAAAAPAAEAGLADLFDEIAHGAPSASGLRPRTSGHRTQSSVLRRYWHVTAIAGAALLGGIILFSGIFKVRTADGTIVLRVSEPNAEVLVDGQTITVHWGDDGKSAEITAPPGKHRIEVKKQGFVVSGTDVTLEDGGHEILNVALEISAKQDTHHVVKSNPPDVPTPPSGGATQHAPVRQPTPEPKDAEPIAGVAAPGSSGSDTLATTALPDLKHWSTDLEDAKQNAAREKKDILLVFFGPDNRQWCLKLAADLLVKQEFHEFVDSRFVLVLLEVPPGSSLTEDSGTGRAAEIARIAARYTVSSCPTLVLTDAEGVAYAREEYRQVSVTDHLKTFADGIALRKERDRLFAPTETGPDASRLAAAQEALAWLEKNELTPFYIAKLHSWLELAQKVDPNNQQGLYESFFLADTRLRLQGASGFGGKSSNWSFFLADTRLRLQGAGKEDPERIRAASQPLLDWQTAGRKFKDGNAAAQTYLDVARLLYAHDPEQSVRFVDGAWNCHPSDPKLAAYLDRLHEMMASKSPGVGSASASGGGSTTDLAKPPAVPAADSPAHSAADNNPEPIDVAAIRRKGAFAYRASEHNGALAEKFGATKETKRAVAAALYWLAKHQTPQGNWSLQNYTQMCVDTTCKGAGSVESLSAATAMGVLPFLGAGQTQATAGPFKKTIAGGINWLVAHQKRDGDLSADAASQMYSHGIATIALCEDYGMTRDWRVGAAARKAVNFIEVAQNQKTGGWRYHPGEEGDTSALGWQLTALKTAQMAGLPVRAAVLSGAARWLRSCSNGNSGRFSYQPAGAPTPPMAAVGLLCNQYLQAARTDPVITGGVEFLMANQPEMVNHNIYYWYYATQAMHNMADKDWDTWNHKIQQILVDSQAREGCAAGSWDPQKPNRDAWGPYGGRVMMTSLSCLTLEVYYRYLPEYLSDASTTGRSGSAGEPTNMQKAAAPPADAIQPGSVWRDADKVLTILERKGDTFRARFDVGPRIVREVTGPVTGDRISWLAKDVRAIRGKPGDDNFGTIHGDRIDFKWGSNGATSGTFTLVREK